MRPQAMVLLARRPNLRFRVREIRREQEQTFPRELMTVKIQNHPPIDHPFTHEIHTPPLVAHNLSGLKGSLH
jgi:hypothetical protein